MKLYKTTEGIVLLHQQNSFLINESWDKVVDQSDLFKELNAMIKGAEKLDEIASAELINDHLLPPIGSQEVWAAGVTYLRSRDARMEESEDSGGADFYQKVYEAARPELFFKALPQRVAGHGNEVYIRKDSVWNVPEPELTLYINSAGSVQGYTVGNDMSSRSIEGENPLYLPQAKVYERSAALGPCLYVPEEPLSKNTAISIVIYRDTAEVFKDSIQINRIKRSFEELAEYLFRECVFPVGCFLMTGTGMVPSSDFTLQIGDSIDITIDGIGTLSNKIAIR
jgi:2-dehydro-3-deoxy-D-arabinonate dehydratase